MRIVYLIFILLSFSMLSMAEEEQKNWTQINVYGFAVGIEGTTKLRGVESDVDASFSDILENLDLGGMVFVEHRRGKWSFIADGLFMKLSAEDSPSTNGILEVDLEVDILQALVEAFIGYRVLEQHYQRSALGIDLFGGARYNYIKLELDVSASGLGLTRSSLREADEDWVDGVIGIRFQYDHDNGWGASFWADIGEGSDSSSYQLIGLVNYSLTSNIRVFGGYRYYQMDYETGSGSNTFELDLDYSGPMVGVGYRF